jgi:hypothetical protein
MHSPPDAHDPPAQHGCPTPPHTQVPDPSHTPVGHTVPGGRLPVGLQTCAPVEQLMVPVWHGFAGLHAAPATQVHVPVVLQYVDGAEHNVPAGSVVVSEQLAAPAAQRIVPDRHAGVSVHAEPMPVTLHVPVALHAEVAPQLVQAGTGVPLSTHTRVPVEQLTVPV